MKRYIDWYTVIRNTLGLILLVVVLLFAFQMLNRMTLASYIESNGLNIDKLLVEDTEVYYHDLFGEEPEDFTIVSTEEKSNFINSLKKVKIRRDYYNEIRLKLFGKTSYSNYNKPSSNQVITTTLYDLETGTRINLNVAFGRTISTRWFQLDEHDKYYRSNKSFRGIILGDYYLFDKR